VEKSINKVHTWLTLLLKVNKGRLSNVWECIHKTSGLRFAAKIVNKRNLSPKDEDLVYQEVSMLSQIRNGPTSLSGLIEFFDEDTRFYIVLDFAEGGDLLTALVQKQKLNEMEAKLLAKSLLDGLVHLHEKKICHRNLKPENLVLKDAQDMSTVVVIDFGMAARVLQDADGDPLNLTERCGTAMFMAPEVIAQIPYDTQADMWSFGVLMFYVLTGVHPYEDAERHALYLKICKNEYSFHPMEWQGVSKTAKRFVANLLHTDPEVRMTAEECLAHSWLAEFLPPPPAPPPELLPSPSKSEPQVNKPASSSKLKGVWRVMKRRKGSVDESENMDDWKSTSSKTTSLLSSNVTGVSDRHSNSK
jgi:serine/threonine protein kinase